MEDWDWSMHTICRTVEELHILQSCPYIRNVDVNIIFYKFPGLKRFTDINNYVSDVIGGVLDVDMNNTVVIEYYHSTHLLPRVEFLRRVKHMVVLCKSVETLEMLLGYMPELKVLEKLEIKLNPLMVASADAITDRQVEQRFRQVIETISSSSTHASLAELRISVDKKCIARQAKTRSIYDLGIIKLLHPVPETVQFIQ
jgi:hypothetical protein